jgi:hypothetical protein
MKQEMHTKMIGHLILVLSALILASCNPSENKKELIRKSDNETALTYRRMMNKPITMDFGETGLYEVIFKSDSTLFWKSMRSGSYGEEKSRTIILDDQRVLTHWLEDDRDVVTILTDFEKMKVHGFETLKTDEIITFNGELRFNQ